MEIDGVFEPPTPAKPVPARFGYNSQTASTSGRGTEKENINDQYLSSTIEYLEGNGNKVSSVAGKDPKSTTTVQNDTSCIQKEADCDGNKVHGVYKSQDFINSTPSPSETKYGRKRRNNGIDLNKKPSQRPRVKKHRPKIYDDSKPKKVPKVKTPLKPKTPKPKTPNRVLERSVRSRKEKFTKPISYDNDDVEASSRASIIALIPCKRSLDLNIPVEIESHHVSNSSHDEFDYFDRIVTSKRNTTRRSRFQKKIVEASDNLLGDNNNNQQIGLDFSVIENLKETKKNVKRFVNVYRCQKKRKLKIFNLKVYKRRAIRVDHCLQSSRESGPNFPKMFKKQRSMRKKVNINANWWLKFLEDVNKKKPHKKYIQTTKSKVTKSKCLLPVLASMKKKRSVFQRRRRENFVDFHFPIPDCDSRFLLCQEENFLQITEYAPLQEVPIYEIESFSSQPSHVQLADNSIDALEWLKSQEIETKSLIPKRKGKKVNAREIKTLIKKLSKLDINSVCKALVVVNNGSKALVTKKREKPEKPKLQAKVDLDEESLRVWKIVMENNGSQPFEEMDNDKKEWWEKQRNVFRGRVESFIAKMHLIQGNRRFSPWKGSVVDSVVGVYLTQNVTDNLSSSAFMHLAARFPVKSKKKEVEVIDYDEVNASQESVRSNTEIFEGLSNNNNKMDQFMITSYADEISMSQTTQLSQTEVSNLQDKPFLDETPKSFRNLLEIDEVDFLKDFYNIDDELALSESQVQEKSSLELEKSTLEEEKSKSKDTKASNLQDKPCIDEDLNTFRKILETEEVDYLKNFCSINVDESALNESNIQENSTFEQEKSTLQQENLTIVQEKSTRQQEKSTRQQENSTIVQEKSTFEQEKSTLEQGESTLQHEKLTFEHEKSTLQHEKSTLEQEKSTLEEESIIVAPVSSSLQSEITVEQRVNAVNNNQESKKKGNRKNKKEEIPQVPIDWDKLREKYCQNGKKEINEDSMDAVDWEAVWRAPVQEIAKTIIDRGMQNNLAKRIKDFLDRIVKDHGSIDLEWLRDVPPDKAKEFLLSIPGIGLKSVECVRLLTLHHNAFPVDTNVGRVATRLGWVPLQPLPEQVQIHLLNSYPMMDSIQKYLYPRLCTLDQKTLYELHYQLITFGKVFCTKVNPNCNACPMRAECRHYASAFASARLALPAPKASNTVTTIVPAPPQPPPPRPPSQPPLPLADVDLNEWGGGGGGGSSYCEPIVEVPPSPEPYKEVNLPDMEDYFLDSDEEIPTIKLNTKEFKETLLETMNKKNNLICHPDGEDLSKAIVVINARASSFRARSMKVREKLRTIHIVYELPDFHPTLDGFDEREQEDPMRYLLAIWPEKGACNDKHEETVKGTVLIPCRTANRGKFPLNGTYFQVNEVFADDETSEIPMDVPRHLLWNLPRRDLGCGTSATSIFKALSTADIQHLFWRGSICVRGFNRKTRQPRDLHQRFHITATSSSSGNTKKGKK